MLTRMVEVCPPFRPPNDPNDGDAPPAGRLNLLLSYSGWQQESWADLLPRLLAPLGVNALRVGTGREASDVIAREPVHIAVVDLALPLDEQTTNPESSEGGPRLLELLSRLHQPPPIVVVRRRRAMRDATRELSAALHHGCFAAVDPPVQLETLLELMRRILNKYYQSQWPQSGNS